MERLIENMGMKYRILYGKGTIFNTFIISQLVYLLSVLPSPSHEMLELINKLLFEFVWNAKPDKKKFYESGQGKGEVSVPDIDQALKVVWV